MRIRRLAVILSGVAVVLALTACGDGGPAGGVGDRPVFEPGTTMERLAKARRLAIGTKFDQPGFGLKGLDGRLAGFDVEVGRVIADELGIPDAGIEWVESPSKVREEYIEQGKVDIMVATYTINDARKQRVSFAGPYYVAGQQLMVRKDDATVTGPDSLRSGAKKVCAVTGATSSKNILPYLQDATTQLVLFDLNSKCVDALKTRQVDAYTSDDVGLTGFVANAPDDFKIVGPKFTEEPYGIGVKKDDAVFREWINTVLERMAADGRYLTAWRASAGKFTSGTPTLPAIQRY